jgi:hypothetical protein
MIWLILQIVTGVGCAKSVHSEQPKESSNRWWNEATSTPTDCDPSQYATFLPNVEVTANLLPMQDNFILKNFERDAHQLSAQGFWTAYAISNVLGNPCHQYPAPILNFPVPDSFECFRPTTVPPPLQSSSHQYRTWHSVPPNLPPMLLPSAVEGIALPPLRLIGGMV